MALNSVTPTITDYQKLRKNFTIEKRPFMMLKDYLLDDLSSCSSSGFKSFPRRQCCTTVRLPTELDVKTKPKTLRTSRSKPKTSTTTINNALQRASVALLNAVRLISLPSNVKSVTPSPSKKTFLPRSFSRKLFRKSFWRKTAEKKAENESTDIKRWKSFREYLEEKDQALDCDKGIVSDRVSVDTSSKSNANTSWDDTGSNFTSETSMSSSGSSEASLSRDGVDDEINKNDSLPLSKNNVSSKRSGAAVGEESPETTTITTTSSEDSNRAWSSEKEQFSPVSILDCPFQDDEEINSPFTCTKQKHRPECRRFENLSAQLEPIDLEKRIVLSKLGNGNTAPIAPTLQPSSAEETNIMQREEELMNIINTTYPTETSTLQLDNLLLDFFAESLPTNGNDNHAEQELLDIAQHWIIGQPLELYLGWEVKEHRHVYLKDMERYGIWKNIDEDKQELVHAVELECWTFLVDELLHDLLHWRL